MTTVTPGLRRLSQQRLTHGQLATPAEVVSWLGAVQSQEYQPALWSLGMRMWDTRYDAIERAFNEGAILRTHVLRPTWHFVAPTDIRWLLELTALRVKASSAYYSRQLELDEATFTRSNDIIARALAGGKSLTRAELGQELARAGFSAEGQRLGHIVMRAELDALICSGPRRGKQFTYALLAERAPQAQTLPRDEALAELTRRYFTSHGPATERDFAWWSGLTLTDARAGLRMVSADLSREELDGRTYWCSASALPPADPSHEAFLLPTYDEMLVGYEGFGAALTGGRGNGEWATFNATVMRGGQVIGNWRRTITKNAAVIEVAPFAPLGDAAREAIFAAAGRYGKFFGVSVDCVGL